MDYSFIVIFNIFLFAHNLRICNIMGGIGKFVRLVVRKMCDCPNKLKFIFSTLYKGLPAFLKQGLFQIAENFLKSKLVGQKKKNKRFRLTEALVRFYIK